MPPGSRLVLLSLDGGGVRGLSSIMIIEDIMKGINHDRSPDSQLKPYQVFDLMGGTSTGGLIAVMLGRLKMSAEECKHAYLRLSERIFQPKRKGTALVNRGKDLWQAKGRFDSKELEEAIKETIDDCKIPAKERFKEPDSVCKVFVCAIPTGNAYTAALFRTYRNHMMLEDSYSDCYTWEACRATSAATTFFDPITIGPMKQSFADGAVAYNNPVQHVYREAQQMWPDRMKDALLITIGTGAAPGPSFEGNAVKVVAAMKKIVTQTEKTNNDFAHDHSEMLDTGRLFRFNVLQGVADVRLEEYKEIPKIAEATRVYLNDAELRSKYRKCVESMKNALEGPSTSSTPEPLKPDQKPPDKPIRLFTVSDIVPLITPHFVGRELELEKIKQYLKEEGQSRKTIVLYGLSGFGKTQLALKYWADSSSLYTSRIWIDATSLETAYESFSEVLSKIGQPLPGILASGSPASLSSSSKLVFSAVKRWLSDPRNVGWLMVIDNVEDLDRQLHIQDLIPEGENGRILVITTQHEALSIIDGESIEVGKIDDDAGAEILTHRFKKQPSSQDVKQLVNVIVTTLQGVPLAIEQAGAYLSIYRTLTADLLHDFIRRLQSEYEKVMSTIPKRSKWYYEKHRSIVDTFNFLREALVRINEDSDKILTLSAFLAPSSIPVSIFDANLSPQPSESGKLSKFEEMAQHTSGKPEFLKWTETIRNDSHQRHAAISTLEDYCCARIRWNDDGTKMISFSIHNAVRMWCRKSWQPDEEDQHAVLAAYYLSRSLTTDANIPIINRQRYLGHVKSCEEILLREDCPECAQAPEGPLWSLAWSASMSFGKFYQQQKYLAEAQAHFKRAIEHEKFAMDDVWPANEISMTTLHLLALVYWQDGKFDEAIETYDTLFQASETVRGNDNELTLRLADELCRVRLRALDNSRDWSRVVAAVSHQKLDSIQTYPSCQAASQEQKPAEAEFDEEEYRLTQITKESAQEFGEGAIETMNAKFILARFYALNSQLTKAAPLAESVWRFRILLWTGQYSAPLMYFLEPFCICLDGYLLDGKPISDLVHEYRYVLHFAITARYEKLLDTLFQDGVLSREVLSKMVCEVDSIGESPLFAAIKYSKVHEVYFTKLIERLLAHGADTSYQTTWGHTLLHTAVMYDQRIVVEKLLAYVVDTDARTHSTNASVLHYAVIRGNLKMVELLLDHGVRVNACTTEGMTPLHLAVLLGNRKMVQLLIKHGANTNMQTQLGSGPLHMVVISPFILFKFKDMGLCQTLISDYTEKLKGYTTTFGSALLNVIRKALEYVQSMWYEWRTYYPFPSFFKHVQKLQTSSDLILKDLVDAGAYINLRCIHLSTPLHLMLAAVMDAPRLVEAAVDDPRAMLQRFLEYGADPHARDIRGIVAGEALKLLHEIIEAETGPEDSETSGRPGTHLLGKERRPSSTEATGSIGTDSQNTPAEDPPENHSVPNDAELVSSTSQTSSPARIPPERSATTSAARVPVERSTTMIKNSIKMVSFAETIDAETSSRGSRQITTTSTATETLLNNSLDNEEHAPFINLPALTQTSLGSDLPTLSQQNLKTTDFDDLYEVSD